MLVVGHNCRSKPNTDLINVVQLDVQKIYNTEQAYLEGADLHRTHLMPVWLRPRRDYFH